jgi:hypothetical protein
VKAPDLVVRLSQMRNPQGMQIRKTTMAIEIAKISRLRSQANIFLMLGTPFSAYLKPLFRHYAVSAQ